MFQLDATLFEDDVEYCGSVQNASEEAAMERLLDHHGRRIWRKARLICIGQACPSSPFSKLNPDLARRVFNVCVRELVFELNLDPKLRDSSRSMWYHILSR
mmetsp:Transcript_57224/g.94609  ORF Transcript_57224/g.94609 Transcript_57224/m.94609 type:complete len:101 (+) Transcript_57224:2-304(+)